MGDAMKRRPSFSERDAIEFIVAEISDEASRAGRPLSETERKMLFFCESAPNAREFIDVAAAFHRECDEDEYERRIAGLIRTARRRADPACGTAKILRLNFTYRGKRRQVEVPEGRYMSFLSDTA